MEKILLEKYYTVAVESYQDVLKRSRRKITISPKLVYRSDESVRDERILHLFWYSSPDPQQYSSWDFEYLLVDGLHLEILTETDLLSEIMMIYGTQPQEFELRLQALGFHKR